MKKKLALVLAATMTAACLSVGASADEYTQVNLVVNGTAVETDQPAVIVDSRTMVPLRVVGETLGCTVDWDGATKTVIFKQNDLTASMVVGEKVLNVTKGEITVPVEVDAPAIIINDRTMVPIRFLSENLNYDVDWDGETKTVSVSKKEAADNVESGAAVEVNEDTDKQFEGMADRELKDAALVVDGYAGVLNESTDKMSEEQAEKYAEYCDAVATVLKTLDSGKYTEEEVLEGAKAVAEAKEGMEAIAEELGVSLEEAEESTEETTLEDATAEEPTLVEDTTSEETTAEDATETTTEAE